MAKTKQLYVCNHCNNPIIEIKDGIVIQGNIYVADPTCSAGIIGNNFPTDRATFGVDSIGETAVHIICFLSMLCELEMIPTNIKNQINLNLN